MNRVTECKPSRDYRLWLRFDDELEESVFLGNLLKVGVFAAWRDVDQSCRIAVDQKTTMLVWDDGIPFDPDILHRDPLLSRAAREFDRPGLVPGVECPVPVRTDFVSRSFNS